MATVRGRAAGQSIPQALCKQVLRTWEGYLRHPRMPEFVALIHSTPALVDYARRMEMRHEHALAAAIAADIGAPAGDVTSAALARFALEAPNLARTQKDPAAALKSIFALIEKGWTARVPSSSAAATTTRKRTAK